MAEKHKHKDKKRKEAEAELKKAKSKKAVVEDASDSDSSSEKPKKKKSKEGKERHKTKEKYKNKKDKQKKDREPEKKLEPQKKDKQEKKEKGKKEAKPDQPTNEQKGGTLVETKPGDAAAGAKEQPKEPTLAQEIGAPPQKKLKAWQDDELEVESGDEGAKGRGPAEAAAGPDAGQGEEPDTLDAFMADLSKEQEREKKEREDRERLEREVARVSGEVAPQATSITLEDIEKLMGAARQKQEAGPSSSSSSSSTTAIKLVDASAAGSAGPLGGSAHGTPGVVVGPGDGSGAASATVDPAASGAGLHGKEVAGAASANKVNGDEEDDGFHAAFMAELRRRRELENKALSADEGGDASRPAFVAAARFDGERSGYVFTTRRGVTGYYLDRALGLPNAHASGPAAVTAAESLPAEPTAPRKPRIPSFAVTAEEGVQHLGFSPSAWPPQPVLVRALGPDSWSERRGLKVGDELVLVNGRDVTSMSKAELIEAMRGRPLHLALARNETAPGEAVDPGGAAATQDASAASSVGGKSALPNPFHVRPSTQDVAAEEGSEEEEEEDEEGAAAAAATANEGAGRASSSSRSSGADGGGDGADSSQAAGATPVGDATAVGAGTPLAAAVPAAAAAAAAKGEASLEHPGTPGAGVGAGASADCSGAAEGEADEPVKEVLTKKEKRRRRREAKAMEEATKAAAKKRPPKGMNDEELLESDPDQSEQSSTEAEPEGYFDLVKKFTTKKTLPEVDHSQIDYKPFRKNLYVQVKEISALKDHEVEDLRRVNGEIKVRGKHCPAPIKSFLQCGLPDKILKIFEKREYEKPFPIQMQAIPALMCGRDVIAVAQTGSGKTLAYLLPMIRHVLDQPPIADGDGPIGFAIAPTRELALQIQREANVFCKAVNLVSVCAYGGGPMGEQLSALKKGAEILVGTPGRLIDVLSTSNGKITNLRRVTFMVLDEADRMFDMGFEPQIGMFLQTTRPNKQVAMFSATLPTHVEALARQVLKKPLEITVGERNTAATNVAQYVEVLEETQKFYRLLQLLGEWHEHGSIIIFVQHQTDVDEMFTELLKFGYPSLALHGGQDQHDRDFTLQDFKDGVANILIATSIAARGIDVKKVILVVNFKVPDHLEDYIHRIGRTGRAGKAGFAFTFIQPDEGDKAQDMVDALRQCGQDVPEKLRRLAEEHQSLVNTGQAKKRRRWGGFGGKGFKYDNTEKSQQQSQRIKAKKDAMIGDENVEEDEPFKDPWDDEKPQQGRGRKDEAAQSTAPQATSAATEGSSPQSTVAAAAQIAQRALGVAATPSATVPGAGQPAAAPAPPGGPPVPKGQPALKKKKTDVEIEEQAQKMAEDTLASLPEEVRAQRLPALKEKLKEKLKKANDAMSENPEPAPPPPPVPKAPLLRAGQGPLIQAVSLVPAVMSATGQDTLVTRSIEQLQANLAVPTVSPTAEEAADRAKQLLQTNHSVPAGSVVDELEINDYPQIARQKISHRDPLLAIEEMTGAKVQVKGQWFSSTSKMPEGAKKLYVEIVGPTTVATSRAKHEVKQMMEALAIRTLNIPGMSRAVGGTPGRYDPMVGR